MLQVICGFVVGLLLAGLGFGLVGGGVPGLDRGRGTGRTWVYRRLHAHRAGATHPCERSAHPLNSRASTLTEPERRIGKMLVSALPNGQKTADTIDAANAQLNSIAMLTKQVRDPAVKAEANDFIAATKD